jgi:hypothetical protein
MKNSKIVLIGLGAAIAGFTLQGCFAAQPPPECSVITGQAVFGVTNYIAQLESPVQSGAASCKPLDNLEIGLARFPLTAGEKGFRVDIRNSRIVDIYNGAIFGADVDDTNNCTAYADTEDCTTCAVPLADAGYSLHDGTNLVDDGTGAFYFVGGEADGGDLEVDVTNECTPVPDNRRDATDLKGEKINAVGKMVQFPSAAGVCVVSDFTAGVQNFRAETEIEGTKVAALTSKTEWSNFEMLNSTKSPSTFWTADLKYTEGACVTSYKVSAWWPIVSCEKTDKADKKIKDANGNYVPDETKCDPNPDVAAGRVSGSGMSPYFKPVCRVVGKDAAGKAIKLVCAPSVTKDELAK